MSPAALAYGWQDVTTDRTVTVAGIDRLRAEFNANAFSGRIEGGYRLVTPWIGGIGLTPYAAAQVTSFGLPAYADSAVVGANTFALSYDAKSITAPAANSASAPTNPSRCRCDPHAARPRRLGARLQPRPQRSRATFQTLPARALSSTAPRRPDAALVTASAEMKWLNGWSRSPRTFEGEFSKVTRSYAGKGVARYEW